MNEDEREAVSAFKTNNEDSGDDRAENHKYYERIQTKCRKLSSASILYVKFQFLFAMTGSVERLFSAARWILTSVQKRLSPILFEMFIFQKMNCEGYWVHTCAAMKINSPERYTELHDVNFYDT